MRVLVAYASRHGSTAGIADRIAERMRRVGVEADSVDMSQVDEIDGYDAYVVGSAAYMFHWMKEARSFVRRHRKVLAYKPLWLFSSGPLGNDLVDDKGRDIFEASRPREFEEFKETLAPMGEKVFFGAWDPSLPPVGMAERFMKSLPAGTEGLPTGDFRDWAAIEAFADEVVADLERLGLAERRV
jgi:menaquinone-dependent protoporphyrinogen oxidase